MQTINKHVDLEDSVIVYKCQMYRGQTITDTGMYFAPYRPGMSAEELAEVQAQLRIDRTPTPLQLQIMDAVRNPT